MTWPKNRIRNPRPRLCDGAWVADTRVCRVSARSFRQEVFVLALLTLKHLILIFLIVGFFFWVESLWTWFVVLSLTIIWFFFYNITLCLYLFCIVWEGKITGFLSLTKKINIIIYALLLRRRHEHCSIVVRVCVWMCVCVCRGELELTWCIVFTETKQCTLGILECGMIMLLPMFFRCDSDRLRIPVRKALLIIPAGGCVCECVSVL